MNNNANGIAYYNNTSETNNNTRDISTPQVMKDLLFQTPCTMKFQMLKGSREGCHSRVTKRPICDPRKLNGSFGLYDINREMELFIQRMEIQQKIFKKEKSQVITQSNSHIKTANSNINTEVSGKIQSAKSVSNVSKVKEKNTNLQNELPKRISTTIPKKFSLDNQSASRHERNSGISINHELKENSSLDIYNKIEPLVISYKDNQTIPKRKCRSLIKYKKRNKKKLKNIKKQKVNKVEPSVPISKPRLVIPPPDFYIVRSLIFLVHYTSW